MTSSFPPNKAWVTLATNDSYSLGALVLAHSLRTVKTVHKLAILITPGVTPSMKRKIEAVFDEVRVVDVLDSKDEAHLALMNRPELGVTFTKLHCWTFTNYEKCVFLDADTLVLQNCDELFDREELSAAPDPGWPDCFNSGVFVYRPSQDTFGKLLEFAKTKGSFDGGDQGLLNMYFNDWSYKDISKHLSFTYNVVWSSTYSYLPALKQFGQSMKIVHFITSSKPWLQSFNTETRLVTATSGGAGLQELLQLWWDLFCRHVHPELSTEMIESRLSSRYSYDFHPESRIYNERNNNALHCTSVVYDTNISCYYDSRTPSGEPQRAEEHYDFVDPWEEYSASDDEQKRSYEVQSEEFVENAYGGDGNAVWQDTCAKNQCESNKESDGDVQKESANNEYRCSYQNDNNCVTELKCNNVTLNEEQNDRVFIENRESTVTVAAVDREIHHPACSEVVPSINSDLSVNNYYCRPGSPTRCEVVPPTTDQTCDLNGGLAGQFARLSLGDEKTADQTAVEDFLRRQSWEHGNADYLGKDSFSNIWAKINDTLQQGATGADRVERHDVPKSPPPPAATLTAPLATPLAAVPEVVHTDEPKPLKSALKKTSTTVPPAESELLQQQIVEPPAVSGKQLEKLDLVRDTTETPGTPTVTSPTPPSTPSSQPAAAAIEETPRPAAGGAASDEPAAGGAASDEPAVGGAASDEPAAGGAASDVPAEKPTGVTPEKPDEKAPSKPAAADAPSGETPAVVDDEQQPTPPVAPKRANKGAAAAAAAKPSEKK